MGNYATEDLVGKEFGFYLVIERAENRKTSKSSRPYWKCRCVCGTEKEVRGESLKSGVIKSCGCRKFSEHRLKRIFDSKYIVKENGCWEWKGCRDKDGYSQIGNGKRGHRYSFERFNGVIPEGKIVCHTCDNPGCVNPEHLFLGTQQDNCNDKVKKCRQQKGIQTWNSKLDDQKVIEIRKMESAGFTSYEIAGKFNISQATAWKVISGSTWKHVHEEKESKKLLRRIF